MKSLTLEKVITRDWPLIFSVDIHTAYTQTFDQQFGWRYTETLFEGKSGVISVYRDLTEHRDGLTNFILKNLNQNPDWMSEQVKAITLQVQQMEKILQKAEKALTSAQNLPLARLLELVSKQNILLHPRYVIMLWFPIHMENHTLRKKYEKAIEQATNCRNSIEKIDPKTNEWYHKVIKYALKLHQIPEKYSRLITLEECLALLKKGVKPTELESREKNFVVCNDGVVTERIEDYCKKKGYLLKQDQFTVQEQLSGNSAYPGLIQGPVKIIPNKDKFGEFKTGDVLVTSMTTPDFAPIINKAAAIVTDEGGITCHAAIVARELKVPCIVGTKNATKNFHDGEMVEVNATKGFIRKI